MSVDDAISSYGTLTRQVFSDVKKVGGDGRFKASMLEKVIKKIVMEQTGQENEHMMGGAQGERCKTCDLPSFLVLQADRSQICPRYVDAGHERPNPSTFPHLPVP